MLDLCRHVGEHAEILVLAPHAIDAALEETLEGVHVRRFRYFIPRWQAVAYSGGITARLRENGWRVLQLPFYFVALWWAARRAIRTWSPDVIHAHWIIPQGLVACLAARSGTPIVCTSHGGDLHGLRSFLFEKLKSWTLARCRATTVVSESMVPHVRALAPAGRVHVIPMGTDLRKLFVPPAAATERDRSHVVFVGRLVEKKGVRYLLDAFAAVKATHPEARLTIVGHGPLEAALRRHAAALGIAEAVAFIGGVAQSALPELYRRATLAVFPFVVAADGDQEGFGLVVVEAMGCGCPVIAGDLPATRASVVPGVTGILTPPGDAEALANAVRTALEDAELRSRLADAALRRVREQFDWHSIAAHYRQLLEDSTGK